MSQTLSYFKPPLDPKTLPTYSDVLITDMQGQQGLAPITPLIEVWVKGYARKLTFEINSIGFMVHGIVQEGIDVGKNVVFSYLGRLAISIGEFTEGPIADCCRLAHHLGV